MQVNDKIRCKENEIYSLDKLYNSRPEQTHMELPHDEKTFCFSDIHSVIERKETLKSKLLLT